MQGEKILMRRTAVLIDRRKADKPTLKAKWIMVDRLGKRQIRMLWAMVTTYSTVSA